MRSSDTRAIRRDGRIRKCRHCDRELVGVVHGEFCSANCDLEACVKSLRQYMDSHPVSLAPVCEAKFRGLISEIDREMIGLRSKLSGLDARRRRFLEICEQIKLRTENVHPVKVKKSSIRFGFPFQCAVCVQEFPFPSTNEHSTKCVNALLAGEAHIGAEKSAIPDLFCDAVDKNGSFCKRLKIQCPSHGGNPFEDDSRKVCCGYPSNISELYDSATSEPLDCCQFEKRGCVLHFGWQRRELTWIDFERLMCWVRLDKLSKRQTLVYRSLDLAKHPLNSMDLRIERQNPD